MKPIKLPKFPQLKIHAGFASAAIAIDVSGSLTSQGKLAIKETVKAFINDLQSQNILFDFTLWAFDNFVHFDSIKKLSSLNNHIVDDNEIDEKIEWMFNFGRGGSSLDESFYFIKAINLNVESLIFITDGIVSVEPDCPTIDEVEKHIFLIDSTTDLKKYLPSSFNYKLTEIFI